MLLKKKKKRASPTDVHRSYLIKALLVTEILPKKNDLGFLVGFVLGLFLRGEEGNG